MTLRLKLFLCFFNYSLNFMIKAMILISYLSSSMCNITLIPKIFCFEYLYYIAWQWGGYQNIKPCNIIIIIYKNRHFYFNYRGCGQILLSIDTVSKMYQCWFDEIFLTLQATCYGCDYYVTIDNVSWMWLLRHIRVRANALRSIVT